MLCLGVKRVVGKLVGLLIYLSFYKLLDLF